MMPFNNRKQKLLKKIMIIINNKYPCIHMITKTQHLIIISQYIIKEGFRTKWGTKIVSMLNKCLMVVYNFFNSLLQCTVAITSNQFIKPNMSASHNRCQNMMISSSIIMKIVNKNNHNNNMIMAQRKASKRCRWQLKKDKITLKIIPCPYTKLIMFNKVISKCPQMLIQNSIIWTPHNNKPRKYEANNTKISPFKNIDRRPWMLTRKLDKALIHLFNQKSKLLDGNMW